VSGRPRRHLRRPLRLPAVAQAVRRASLLHGRRLQEPLRTSERRRTPPRNQRRLGKNPQPLTLSRSDPQVPPEDSTGRPPARGVRSVLLISERNAGHVVGVLRYLERTNAPLPPELLVFARRVYEAREDQKTDRPLCGYLKSFGVCRSAGPNQTGRPVSYSVGRTY